MLYIIISSENKIDSNLIINPIPLYNHNIYADFIIYIIILIMIILFIYQLLKMINIYMIA